MALFLTVENRFRRWALLLPVRAFSFLLSMQFALTLENGETLSSLTKSNLESAILELQSDVTLPTRKNELLALLTSLVKNELGRRSTFGLLPDWRAISSLNVAALRVAISERNGSTVGTKAVLCRELERLNREALGLSPRILPTNPIVSPLSPNATEFVPQGPSVIPGVGVMPNGAGATLPAPLHEVVLAPPLSPLGTGVSQPLPPPTPLAQQSPLGHFAAQNAATMALGAAPQANYDTFSSSSETPDDALADPVIDIVAGAALRIASEGLVDDPSIHGGKINLADLLMLFSHVALDASAGQMPVGSNLSYQAFGKLHDAIAAPLLAAPRASSKSELFRRCRQLLSDSSMMLTATDFIPPEVAPPGASDYFQGYNLAQFGLFGFFRYATLNKLCGGLIRFVQRDPDSNPNLNMLLGDLLSPTKAPVTFSDYP